MPSINRDANHFSNRLPGVQFADFRLTCHIVLLHCPHAKNCPCRYSRYPPSCYPARQQADGCLPQRVGSEALPFASDALWATAWVTRPGVLSHGQSCSSRPHPRARGVALPGAQAPSSEIRAGIQPSHGAKRDPLARAVLLVPSWRAAHVGRDTLRRAKSGACAHCHQSGAIPLVKRRRSLCAARRRPGFRISRGARPCRRLVSVACRKR